MRFTRKLALLFALAALSAAAVKAQSADEHFNNGLARAEGGDFAAAISEMDKAIARRGNFADAYRARAHFKLLTNDLDGALADLSRAAELDPRGASVHFTRGQIMLETGREKEAQKDFARSLELDPTMKPLVDSTLAGHQRERESKRP